MNLQTAKGGRAFTVVTQTDQPVLISPVERDDVEKKMLGNKIKARERGREKRNRKRRMANEGGGEAAISPAVSPRTI